MNKLHWAVLVGLLAVVSARAASVPSINAVTALNGGRYAIVGGGFGRGCGSCEVVARYATLSYALPVLTWTPSRIETAIPDLNLGSGVALRVSTPSGISAEHRLELAPRMVPAHELSGVAASTPPGLLMFEKRSNLLVGDRGEEVIPVSSEAPTCGASALVFDHANLLFGERRFADAQFTRIPSTGCITCQPLVVRWFHEPTGHLHFQVHVYRRRVEGVCRDRIRVDEISR